MKKNGFTLVEVLAMLTVIGIIMLVSIPNISGMLKNQRLNYFKSDAIGMVESAKLKIGKDSSIVKPKNGECVIFTLKYLDDDDNMVNGPNGGLYDKFDSVVVYTRTMEGSTNKYKYYVRLVENVDGERVGLKITDSDDLDALKIANMEKITDNIKLTGKDTIEEVRKKIGDFGSINSLCKLPEGSDTDPLKTVIGYYSGENFCTYSGGVYYDKEGNEVTLEEFNESCAR